MGDKRPWKLRDRRGNILGTYTTESKARARAKRGYTVDCEPRDGRTLPDRHTTKKRGRPRPLTKRQVARFLEELCNGYSITYSACAAGHDRRSFYEYRDRDDVFRAAWDEAIEAGTDKLEDEARRRAFTGIDEPVIYKGEITDSYIKYSDTLLMFLLNGRRPERFKQTHRVEHTGKGGGPIELVTIDAIDAEIARLHEALSANDPVSVADGD